MRVPSAEAQISNWGATTGTGLPGPLEDVAAMNRLSLAPEQVSLRASQGNAFR